MSSYSGKCDFKDHIDIIGVENVLASNIYIGRNPVPLRMNEERDLIPYYPYLISMAVTENGKGNIYLNTRSFVDIEEEELLLIALKDLLRYYKRCKRKHVPYIPQKAIQATFGTLANNADLEIAKRIAQDGIKADIKGIHEEFRQYYRDLLYKEMINAGYNEFITKRWVYGEG